MPAEFWAKAVKTTVYILNRFRTKSVEDATPYERWTGCNASHESVFQFGTRKDYKPAHEEAR